MRIAVLTHTFFPIVGGAEIGIHEIFQRFPDDDVTVITPIAADYADAFSVAEHGGDTAYRVIRYVRRPSRFRSPRLRRLASLLAWQEFRMLRRMHRDAPLDAINVHFVQPFGLIALWSRLFLRVPVTLTLIGRTDVWASLSTNLRRHAAVALRAASSSSQITEFCLQGSPFADVPVLPYGVDSAIYRPDPAARARVRSRLGLPKDTTVLVAAQRLNSVKRVDVLIDVAAQLELEDPGAFHLVVIGKGAEEAALRDKVSASHITNVTFVGFVPEDELPAYYAASDIFVAHSMFETFGVMFAEAMATGLPIVAARTSSVPMVVSDPDNGTLVEPFDVGSFVAAIRRLRADTRLAGEISRRNREKATTLYDWSNIATQMRSLLGARG